MIALPMNEQMVTLLMENGPGNMDVRAFIMQKDNDYPPRIVVAYETLDGDGEQIDAGIEGPEEGSTVLPDGADLIEGETIVSLAVRILKGSCADTPSSSFFHPGIWYETDYAANFRTGEISLTRRSYHLKGFLPEQEQEIYNAMTAKK